MSRAGLPLNLVGISKSYAQVRALHPTDLAVEAGEFLTLLGPSGSGKTTLLNLTAGYIEPSTGKIRIGERDVTDVPARHRNIGMVFQSYALFPHMNVAENIGYGLRVRRQSQTEIDRRVAAVLEMLHLSDCAARPVQALSGGQQQRVALARALVIEPDVLLMDEPLGALDKQLRRTVQLELRRLHTQLGRTTIYVTHDQEEALVLSDRIAVMGEGRVRQLGPVRALYDRPETAFVAGFIGESNLLDASVLSTSGGIARAEVASLGRTVEAPAAAGVDAGVPAKLLLRPENLRIGARDEGVPARVVETVYLGELTQFELRLESGQLLTARQVTHGSIDLDAEVGVSWEMGKARIVPAA
jgi:spermidine/putrescine ABC transporter ATP-binding subunit